MNIKNFDTFINEGIMNSGIEYKGYIIKNNQYLLQGKASSYYYIVDSDGKTYHTKDKKWRKNTLKDLATYKIGSVDMAKSIIDKF
jgi:hypothetical protein